MCKIKFAVFHLFFKIKTNKIIVYYIKLKFDINLSGKCYTWNNLKYTQCK